MKSSDESTLAEESAQARVTKTHAEHGYHPFMTGYVRVSESKKESKKRRPVSRMILVEFSSADIVNSNICTQSKRKYRTLDKDPALDTQIRVDILNRGLDLSESHTFYLELPSKTKKSAP